MAFCSFSTENHKSSEVLIDIAFFDDYMPNAPEICTKVYLYGLSKCYGGDLAGNTIEDFETKLNLSKDDIESAFLFWQDEGLVKVLNLSPIEVKYLPIRAKKWTGKIFAKDKYSNFNSSIQEILDGRMITPHEYKEYYLTMESLQIEPDAMLMIAKFCANAKGTNVGYSYILTVAKNWAYDGVKNVGDVEKKLAEMEKLTSKVKDVLVALKSKKAPSFDDKELFERWTKTYGYTLETLVHIAKTVKRGGINYMATLVDNYYALHLFSETEIDDYERNKQDLFDAAKEVCKSLGLRYDNLDPVINTYIIKWKQMGYSHDAIKLIANICFKKYIRTLEDMDDIVAKYFANGLVSIDSINDYISQTLTVDKKIKDVLKKLELNRAVTSWDRDFYHTWTYSWKFDDDVIDYALSLATGKNQPMTYVNKILSNWKEQNISTLTDAQNLEKSEKNSEKQAKNAQKTQKSEEIFQKQFTNHSFSSEELNALFDGLNEVKLI